MRKSIVTLGFLAAFVSFSPAAMAQEQRNEISVQGTGSFTKDSDGKGISQHTTDSGGFLANYRYHFTRWLAAEANYGYNRNTIQNFTSTGLLGVNTNTHQATGALVFTAPSAAGRFQPYALVGGGALTFDPRNDVIGMPIGVDRQTKGTFLYGGGANVSLIPHIALRLEYRGLVYKRPDFGMASLDSGATAHTALPTIGVSFRF